MFINNYITNNIICRSEMDKEMLVGKLSQFVKKAKSDMTRHETTASVIVI